MTSVALNGLWTYIQTLNLSKRNRKWLADKLIEPQAKEIDSQPYSLQELHDRISLSEQQFANGETITNEEANKELDKLFAS